MKLALLFLGFAGVFAETWTVGHIAADTDNFRNILVVANASAESRTFSCKAFSDEGEALGLIDAYQVPPFATWMLDIADLFPTTPAYLLLEAEPALVFHLAYSSNSVSGGTAYLPATQAVSRSWRLYSGNWAVNFDGLAVLNLNDQTVALSISQRDGNHQLLGETTRQLEPGTKLKILLENEFDAQVGSHFEITASLPVSLVALSGSRPGTMPAYLWVNPVQDMGEPLQEDVSFPDNEDGPYPDMLTPAYYEDASVREDVNTMIFYARQDPIHHPLDDGSGNLPSYMTPDIGAFGAQKGPNGDVQHHAALDLHVGNRQTEVNLYAAHEGTVSTVRDAAKYRQYLAISREVTDGNGVVVGKMTTLYAHLDLDLDEADGMFMDGRQVARGELVSRHLYAGTTGGPHLHFEMRYYRPVDEGDEDFYGGNVGAQGNPAFTEPGQGAYPQGYWLPGIGFGFADPRNQGLEGHN